MRKATGRTRNCWAGKGANLCEMTQIGLPVPPGFVISTEACLAYLDQKKRGLQPELMKQIREAMAALEKKTGKGFGDAKNPLLVSVRSGAAMSMPGMMDTILNLGLNQETVAGLIKATKNERFGYDAYRRFIQLFGSVCLDIKDEDFDEMFSEIKGKHKVKEDVDLPASGLKEVSEGFLEVYQKKTGKPFPSDPFVQLERCGGGGLQVLDGKTGRGLSP